MIGGWADECAGSIDLVPKEDQRWAAMDQAVALLG
jgi:hypothetical protein